MSKSAWQVRFVQRVRKEHGTIFVESLDEKVYASGVMVEAFADTGIMTWPDDERAQDFYQRLEDEILERTFDAVHDALAEAFVEAAMHVLDRERKRRRNG